MSGDGSAETELKSRDRIGSLAERAPFELPFWVISDTHFFHHNIIRYAGRPNNHDQLMLKRWRETVGADDLILHLGDLALGKREQIEELAPKLPGDRWLILGNHDRRSKRFYYHELGFRITKPFILSHRGWRILFSHQPDYPLLHVRHPKTLNVHGHIHQKLHSDRRMINVSVEQTDYRPVQITDLIDERIDELERG